MAFPKSASARVIWGAFAAPTFLVIAMIAMAFDGDVSRWGIAVGLVQLAVLGVLGMQHRRIGLGALAWLLPSVVGVVPTAVLVLVSDGTKVTTKAAMVVGVVALGLCARAGWKTK